MLSVGLFAACADDNDSNPVIGSPSTFNLNTPSYAAIPVDLATSTELPFTWSQPDYGFPVAADYQLEASIDKLRHTARQFPGRLWHYCSQRTCCCRQSDG